MIKDFSHFSNRRKSKWSNTNGLRSLYESIIPNEVRMALDDWKDNHREDNYVLIGGLCLSYYLRPRYTEDVDLMFLTEEDLPDHVHKFKRIRPHAFEHIRTGVEVEMVTPETVNTDPGLFKKVFDNSIISDGVRIASPVCLIALKLGRLIQRDIDDIRNLYKYCMDTGITVDLSGYGLSPVQMDRFKEITEVQDTSENHFSLDFRMMRKSRHNLIRTGTYNIRVFESGYGEPVFYLSNDLENIRRPDDFSFAISLTRPGISIVGSSTGYADLTGHPTVEKFIREWDEENRDELIEKWNSLNPRRKIRQVSK